MCYIMKLFLLTLTNINQYEVFRAWANVWHLQKFPNDENFLERRTNGGQELLPMQNVELLTWKLTMLWSFSPFSQCLKFLRDSLKVFFWRKDLKMTELWSFFHLKNGIPKNNQGRASGAQDHLPYKIRYF